MDEEIRRLAELMARNNFTLREQFRNLPKEENEKRLLEDLAKLKGRSNG